MRFGIGGRWTSVGAKLGLGVGLLALVAGAIGGVSLVGLGEVGRAVERSGGSVAMLSDVNEAAAATMQFLDDRAPEAADKAREAVARLQAEIGAAGLSDGEAADIGGKVGAFSTALDGLIAAAIKTEDVQQAALERLSDLQDLGSKVQADSFAQADAFAADADAVAKQLAEARGSLDRVAGVRAGTLRAMSALKSHAISGENRFVVAAGAGIGGVVPLLKKLVASDVAADARPPLEAAMAGVKEAADLVKALRKAEPTEAAAIEGKAIDLLEAAANAMDEIDRLQAKAADALAYDQQGKDVKRTAALDTSRLGAEFSAHVAALAAETFRYRGAPSAEGRARIDGLVETVGAASADIEAAGFAGVTAKVDAFDTSFDDLVAATSELRSAADDARAASLASAAAIRDLAAEMTAGSKRTGGIVTVTVAVAIAIALVLAVLMAMGLHRSIAVPVRRLTAAMRRLAEGDVTVVPEGETRSDEIGAMAATVRVFRDGAVERQRLAAEADASDAARRQRQERVDALVTRFRTEVAATLQSVAEHAQRMEKNAAGLADVAGAAAERAAEASDATGNAAGAVGSAAAATGELRSSIDEIGAQTAKAVDVVGRTSVNAGSAGEKVSRLADAAERIDSVVSLIRSIAEQTNLLALNATIEAARAGEAGKGFAVVAGEVKTLAGQTSSATADIARQVEEIQATTHAAVEAIRVITGDMTDVDRFTAAIAAAVEEQGAATGEIAGNVQSAADSASRLQASVKALQTVVSDTTHSSREVLDLSRSVTEKAGELNASVERFLTDVAAA